jgi:hypothetical protein
VGVLHVRHPVPDRLVERRFQGARAGRYGTTSVPRSFMRSTFGACRLVSSSPM